MKFPITRDRLANIKSEVVEDLMQIATEEMIDKITAVIIQTAFNQSDGHNRYGRRAIDANTIRNPAMIGGKKIKVDIHNITCGLTKITEYNRLYRLDLNHLIQPNQIKTCLPNVIEKVKERFPDIDFIVDPLETYILIDWS